MYHHHHHWWLPIKTGTKTNDAKSQKRKKKNTNSKVDWIKWKLQTLCVQCTQCFWVLQPTNTNTTQQLCVCLPTEVIESRAKNERKKEKEKTRGDIRQHECTRAAFPDQLSDHCKVKRKEEEKKVPQISVANQIDQI